MALSSKWALGDHLEYCGEDKLCELDGYDEGKSAKTVELAPSLTQHLPSTDSCLLSYFSSGWSLHALPSKATTPMGMTTTHVTTSGKQMTSTGSPSRIRSEEAYYMR